jgi:peptide/nickel transport system substrate-binding protein
MTNRTVAEVNLSHTLHRGRGSAAVIALLVLVVAGCGAATSSTTSKPTSEPTGGTLYVDSDFTALLTTDPATADSIQAAMIDHAVYDTLLTFNGTDISQVVPDLATAYTESANDETLTLTLRRGVLFSNGASFTSADVLFTFNRDENMKGFASGLLVGVTVSAPSAYTVVLSTSTPDPGLPFELPNPSLGILNATQVMAAGGTDAVDAATADKAGPFFLAHSAGSGPYTMESFNTTTEVILEANPHYWGPKPVFSLVVISNVPAGTQALDVERDTDEVDINVPNSSIASLKTDNKVNVISALAPNIFFLMLSTKSSISSVTSNADIQDAIRLGLSYKALTALGGAGTIQAASFLPQGVTGALSPSEELKTNVSAAKADVAASGITNPTFILTYPTDYTSQGVSYQTLAESIQSQLAAVGITVSLKGSPITTWAAAFVGGTTSATVSEFPLVIPDPSNLKLMVPGGTFASRAGWTQGPASLETLVSQAESATQSSQRISLYEQLQLALNKDSPFIPLIQPELYIVSTSNLTGIYPNPDWQFGFASVGGTS